MQPGVVRKTSAALIVPAVADSKDSPLQDADLLPCKPGLYLDSQDISFLNFTVIWCTTAHAFLDCYLEADDTIPQILKERAVVRGW